MATYHHTGVPVTTEKPGESYLEGGNVYYTDPEKHPYNFEFLRFEENSPMPRELQTMPHVAFMVDDLDASVAGEKIVLEPFSPFEGLRCAFIMKDGVLLEIMQQV